MNNEIQAEWKRSIKSLSAAVLSQNVEVSSHTAVIRLFGLHFVRSGLMDREMARILSQQQEERQLADYDVIYEATKDKVEVLIEDAKKFCCQIEKYLKKLGVL